MTPFRSAPVGYVARWAPLEREVLARVARDVAELLRADSGVGADVEVGDGVAFTGVARLPQDPAVQRLLPDAHRDDEEVAAEFRHLTQTDLAAGKAARLEAFAETLSPAGPAPDAGPDAGPGAEAPGDPDEVVVPREDAEGFAGALTDVRLVLAERLALEEDADVEALHDQVLGDALAEADDDPDDDPDDDDLDDAGLSGAARRYWGGVFVAAGFAQETLMDEMLHDLRAGRGGPGPSGADGR
ncbi:DUF2017 family protein [Isoptericola cucumis]|uniref:DUF2017 family protein n=1 Tax=Isoptericola cucumis TaxID=1776856 RepID=UPI00320A9366